MTPGKLNNVTNDETRKARGLDLQTAYAVLIRAYLRRQGAEGNGNQMPTDKAPSLP